MRLRPLAFCCALLLAGCARGDGGAAAAAMTSSFVAAPSMTAAAAPLIAATSPSGRPYRLCRPGRARRRAREIDARGLAVAPGFINML